MNVKFVDAKQAKETYRYGDIKGNLYKTNTAVWHKKSAEKTSSA